VFDVATSWSSKKDLLFPARKSLVSDIPAGDGKTANLFLKCSAEEMTKEKGKKYAARGVLRGDKMTYIYREQSRWGKPEGKTLKTVVISICFDK
jgi:hypothetical protein